MLRNQPAKGVQWRLRHSTVEVLQGTLDTDREHGLLRDAPVPHRVTGSQGKRTREALI